MWGKKEYIDVAAPTQRSIGIRSYYRSCYGKFVTRASLIAIE